MRGRREPRPVVGITDYAQDALGDVVYVQLPDVGRHGERRRAVRRGRVDQVGLRHLRAGRRDVVEVNESLNDAPEQLNTDPYGAGWIFVVELSDPAEVDALMDAAGYRQLVEEQ